MLHYPNGNAGYSSWAYIEDQRYANSGKNYIQSYQLIEKDIINLFEYIEPSDINLKTYSHRIHSLIIRLCIDIESNFKAILEENEYHRKTDDLNMSDYQKIYKTHKLSSYEIKIKNWHGENFIYQPFQSWDVNISDTKTMKSLEWYQNYNIIKHNKHKEFQLANLENLLLAASGLVVLLCSQFGTQNLSDTPRVRGISSGEDDYFTHCQSDIFKVKFPNDFSDDEKYNFDWTVLSKEKNPFQKLFSQNLQ